MKKRIIVILGISIFLIASIFMAKNYIEHKKNIPFHYDYTEINILLDANYPPYIFKDGDGKLKGYVVDEWILWEKNTGIKANLHSMDWDLAQDNMKKTNNYDVIDSIFINEERKKFFSFSKPYESINVPIFTQKNISGITDVDSLKGFTVGVKKGDSSASYLLNNNFDGIKYYDSYEDIIVAAKNKRIGIFIMDEPSALYYMYKYNIQNKFKYTEPLYIGKMSRAVKKGNVKMLNVVEYGFSNISRAEYNALRKKWFGNGPLNMNNLKEIVFFLAIIIVIIFLLLIWNRTLKKIVNQRTSELIESSNKINTIINTIPDILFILNRQGIFIDYLRNNEEESNRTSQFYINKSIVDVFSDEISKQYENSINLLLDTGEMQIIEYKSKELYYEARLVLYSQKRVLVMIRDITERKIAEKRIYNLSMYDITTGLKNRNYFENEIERHEKNKTINIGLAICDIDGLKLVNDTSGHIAGDEYLRFVATILSKNFSSNDVVARIGGDEFAVIMQNATHEKFESIKKSVKKDIGDINNTGSIVPISISFGFAIRYTSTQLLRETFKEADNYMYREKLHHRQSTKSKNIELLMKMLEARDFITEGHGERLVDLGGKLAKAINMSDSQVKDINLLGQFHDIGKVGIADSILFKPGKLDDDEWKEMKRHTDIGFRIAESSPDLIHISDWILKHHESWNGKGYPVGLEGEEIPIQCRILAIVDAFDAMTNDRPYRKALPIDTALKELKRCSGEQFDPYLVDKFVKLINDNIEEYAI